MSCAVCAACSLFACLPLTIGCAAQVLKQVGGSLSDFRVGMCNIFCAPRIWL